MNICMILVVLEISHRAFNLQSWFIPNQGQFRTLALPFRDYVAMLRCYFLLVMFRTSVLMWLQVIPCCLRAVYIVGLFLSLGFKFSFLLFVRDGIHSVADYNSTRMAVVVVVVVVVVVYFFTMG